jgi:ribosome-binding protein aMBF1 (putative translation factor)
MKKTAPRRRRRAKKDPKELARRLAAVKNPLVKAFAFRLAQWRQTENKTLKEVGGAIDLSVAIICEWEHGRRFPSVDHLLALSRYSGIPASEFLREPKRG